MAQQPIEFNGLTNSDSALQVLGLVSKGHSVYVTNHGQGTFLFRPVSEIRPSEFHADISPSEFASHVTKYLNQVARGKALGIVKDGELICVVSRIGVI